MPEALSAGLGEALLGEDVDAMLCAVGLGSCVALCLFDQQQRRAALAHVVLPSQEEEIAGVSPCERGDWGQVHPRLWRATGLACYARPALEALLCRVGDGRRPEGVVIAALVGGARVLRVGPGMDIGKRNVNALRQALGDQAVAIGLEEVGGEQVRSVFLHVSTGEVLVRPAGEPMRSLGFLGSPPRRPLQPALELPGLEDF